MERRKSERKNKRKETERGKAFIGGVNEKKGGVSMQLLTCNTASKHMISTERTIQPHTA